MSETQVATSKCASVLQIAWIFLRIGATSFGGLAATLAVIHRELVEERRLLTTQQITEALTFTKPLPGATAFQVVSYLGYRLGGWPASAIAAVTFVLPPMLGMVLMARLFDVVHGLPRFPSVLTGVVAAVVGLLLATTYRLGRANVKGLMPLFVTVAAFTAVAGFQINGALVVVVAGLFGLVAFMSPADKASKQEAN